MTSVAFANIIAPIVDRTFAPGTQSRRHADGPPAENSDITENVSYWPSAWLERLG